MNVDYINPFLSSTIELFERTFGLTPVAGEAFLDDRARKHRWDVSAVMVLTGSAIGVVVIRLTKVLADKLLQRSGVLWKDEEERRNLCDAMVGEMVNIVSGNASGKLTGYKIEISVPLVIQGENHTISWPDRAPIIGVPFSTDCGPFLVNVCLIELPKAYR
jgi:Predicted inhibitor of MCP methylation, homolog of CheC